MRSNVDRQSCLGWESFITILARIWLLHSPGVDMNVRRQVTLLRETYATVGALMGLLARVGQNMIGQAGFVSKTFITILTRMWFLLGSSVSGDMSL